MTTYQYWHSYHPYAIIGISLFIIGMFLVSIERFKGK